MSIVKNYSKTGKKCRVTFKLSAVVAEQHKAEKVELRGDFNDWGKTEPCFLKPLKDGSLSATLSLDSDKEYRFKYLINDSIWENDDSPDAWISDGNGNDNSQIKLAADIKN